MTSSPAEQAAEAGKKAVNRAIESQQQLTADLQKQTGFDPNREGGFIGVGAPQSFEEGSELLAGITGADPAAYVSGTRGIYPQLAGVTDVMRGSLASFKPGVIDSGSTRKVTDYVQRVLNQYERGLTKQTSASADRLRELPGTAKTAFETSFLSPAFEMQKHKQSMEMAENPNTVSQLTDPRYQKGFREYMEYGPSDFYNYNV